MTQYIAVADVDTLLGSTWTADNKKDRAVMIANVWLTNQKLPDATIIPDDQQEDYSTAIKQAGAEVASDAAKGLVYPAVQTGVLKTLVRAGEVISSKELTNTSKKYTAGESLALALLQTWFDQFGGGNRSGILWIKKV